MRKKSLVSFIGWVWQSNYLEMRQEIKNWLVPYKEVKDGIKLKITIEELPTKNK